MTNGLGLRELTLLASCLLLSLACSGGGDETTSSSGPGGQTGEGSGPVAGSGGATAAGGSALGGAASLTIKNTISLGTNGALSATSTDITNNSWQDGRSATADDFVSVDTALLKSPRQSDGSLPDIDYLRLVPGSDLRNAGADVGLPYNGSAPDIGPFESDE